MKLGILLGILMVSSLSGTALAQSFGGFGDSPFERDFSDIKYLDSYFGTPDSKIEVAPGDKNVPFTVVLANVGTQDIIGIQGELSLPYGFSPVEDTGFLILADSNANSMAGEIFHLTFYLNIEQYAEIRQYPAAVKVDYSRLRESGVRSAFFDFVFKVPGSSILNVYSIDQFLMSLQENTIRVVINNNGTAPLLGTDVQLAPPDADTGQSNLDSVVIYNSNWKLGDIPSNSSKHIDITMYVPETLKGQTLRLPLQIDHLNAYGEETSEGRVVDFYVRGLVDLSVYGIDTLTLSDSTMIVGEIINEGNEDALFSFVSVRPLADSNISEQRQFVDEIETDSPVPFNLPLVFEGPPVYGEHEIEVTVRYKDDIREEHFLTERATITVNEPQPTSTGGVVPGLDPSAPEDPTILMIAAAAVLAAIVGVLVVIKRRR